MGKTFEYLSFIDKEATPRFAKKVGNAVKSAETLGFNAKARIYDLGFESALKFLIDVMRCNASVAFIRFSSVLFPLLFIPLLILRLKGTKIVVDVPTPRLIVLKELSVSIKSPLVLLVKKAIFYLSGSWVLFPAHLIVQYANESPWFSLGVGYKTTKIGNGILITENKNHQYENAWDGFGTLNLIDVAQIADWHGFDRLINALADIDFNKLTYDIKFTIVGGGDSLPDLQ